MGRWCCGHAPPSWKLDDCLAMSCLRQRDSPCCSAWRKSSTRSSREFTSRSNVASHSCIGRSCAGSRRYSRRRPSARLLTSPTSPSTRRCFDTWGWDIDRSLTIAPTGFSPKRVGLTPSNGDGPPTTGTPATPTGSRAHVVATVGRQRRGCELLPRAQSGARRARRGLGGPEPPRGEHARARWGGRDVE